MKTEKERRNLMAVRNASAVWEGTLREGRGTMKVGSGAFEGSYSFGSRFESARGTNPEELIAAAHAGCFSMALSGGLARAGFAPKRIETIASVHLDKVRDGFAITRIELDTQAQVPGIGEPAFLEQAEAAKKGCPVSVALASVEIVLHARLVS
jgi:osmotically inducible protein OsmC